MGESLNSKLAWDSSTLTQRNFERDPPRGKMVMAYHLQGTGDPE